MKMQHQSGKTAFHVACKRSNSDVVKIFMENASFFNLDLNAKTIFDGEYSRFKQSYEIKSPP